MKQKKLSLAKLKVAKLNSLSSIKGGTDMSAMGVSCDENNGCVSDNEPVSNPYNSFIACKTKTKLLG